MLIRKSLSFTLLDLYLDPEWKFVIPMVVVGLDNPLPASVSLITKVSQLVATFSTDHVVLAGYFNKTPCPQLDRLTPDAAVDSPLSRWASTFVFTDVWRWKYPLQRSYTCQSAFYAAMSRIDLVYVSSPVLAKVVKVSILPRRISDHAPLFLSLNVLPAPTDCLWHLPHYWISDKRIESKMESDLQAYWQTNPPALDPASSWDAFKTYAQGQL